MFFLVSHRWTPAQDAAASRSLIQLMLTEHPGHRRRPWPRLITLWQNPRQREVTACWESPTRRQLARRLSRERALNTEITHVRQLFPPHVQGYNAMEIKTNPNWGPGLQ
jgi:hypothetical protein